MNEIKLIEFISLCENSSFKYKDEILNGIEKGKLEVVSHFSKPVSAKTMLDIYKSRTHPTKKRVLEHAERLRKDTLIYCENLANNLNENISIWEIKKDEVWGYVIFEGIKYKKVLGCLWVANKRYMSSEEVKEIYGHEKRPKG